MLRTIQIRNFESFDDSGPIELEPLTVLCVSNATSKPDRSPELGIFRSTAVGWPR
jgi:predicted ATPase